MVSYLVHNRQNLGQPIAVVPGAGVIPADEDGRHAYSLGPGYIGAIVVTDHPDRGQTVHRFEHEAERLRVRFLIAGVCRIQDVGKLWQEPQMMQDAWQLRDVIREQNVRPTPGRQPAECRYRIIEQLPTLRVRVDVADLLR